MLLMIEKGIRGGISNAFKRYAKANNKFMKDFDPAEKSSFIVYLDANNLYGWAMSKPLPVGGFEKMNEKELKNWERFVDKEGIGCILEVDLEYPVELHDFHNDFPLAPERLTLGKVEKLTQNLRDKEKMVLHGKNLQLYLSLLPIDFLEFRTNSQWQRSCKEPYFIFRSTRAGNRKFAICGSLRGTYTLAFFGTFTFQPHQMIVPMPVLSSAIYFTKYHVQQYCW